MEQGKNILLLAMSAFPRFFSERTYIDLDGEEIRGRSQLEPITKFVIKKLAEEGKCLDRIIVLNTDATLKTEEKELLREAGDERPPEKFVGSPYEFYKQQIQNYVKSKYENIYIEEASMEFCSIPINEFDPSKGIVQAISLINEVYTKDSQLYLDTQGSFRDIVFVMTSVIKMLKIRGISPTGIYSIHFSERNQSRNEILDKTKSYSISDFVSGMDEFINYGRGKQLLEYYADNQDEQIQNVLNAIKGISDGMSICNPDKFDKSLNALRKSTEQYQSKGVLFDIFVNDIKNDYGVLLKPGITNYADVVEWCRRKEFYQQALTFIEDKFPRYYVRKKYFYYLGNEKSELQKSRAGKPNAYKDPENYFVDDYWRTLEEAVCDKIYHVLSKEAARILQKDEKARAICEQEIYEFFVDLGSSGRLHKTKQKTLEDMIRGTTGKKVELSGKDVHRSFLEWIYTILKRKKYKNYKDATDQLCSKAEAGNEKLFDEIRSETDNQEAARKIVSIDAGAGNIRTIKNPRFLYLYFEMEQFTDLDMGDYLKYKSNLRFVDLPCISVIPAVHSDVENREKLDLLLQLHSWMKWQRNSSNHAEEKGRIPLDIIDKAIQIYLAIFQTIN